MTQDKTIYIKNIYYMFSYAFKVLKQQNYEKVEAEKFEHIENLFAAILDRGLAQLLKQGLYKEYVNKNDNLKVLRGKIDITQTIRNKIKNDISLACEYDELSVDNIFNQIIKTTAILLLKNINVTKDLKNSLKKKLIYFEDVKQIELINAIRWDALKFHANNKTYEMVINVCCFVLNGQIQTTDSGKKKVVAFSEEHMERLYEKFILEYYRKEHPELSANASQVEWNIDDKESPIIKFLPRMQTDITLTNKKGKMLIIDAKYYGEIMTKQERFDSRSYHSNNMYQIFTYVKNADQKNKGNVAGVLMYAQTIETDVPVGEVTIGGNRFGIKTLDLNVDFTNIRKQLDNTIKEFL